MVTAFSAPRGWKHEVQSNMRYPNIDTSTSISVLSIPVLSILSILHKYYILKYIIYYIHKNNVVYFLKL